jgi:predicted transcriptional regulator
LELRKPLIAIVLSMIIVFSLIALIQQEKSSFLSINPAFSNQPAFEDLVRTAQSSLINNSTRTEVYDFIVGNPGIQFRGICTGLCIAVGTAEFHLGVLKKAGLISFVRDGRYKRFFAAKKFSSKEIKLICLLRHETLREILKIIIAEKTVSHSKLVTNLSITSQGLTWQINRLREEKIIQESNDGIKVNYSLNDVYVQALPRLLNVIE